MQLPVGGAPYCLFLRDFVDAVCVGKGSSWRIGASIAWGIHLSSVMVLVARSKACCKTSCSVPDKVKEATEKHPASPQVMFEGLGSGFAATASAFLANRTEAVATEAKRKSRMVASVVVLVLVFVYMS